MGVASSLWKQSFFLPKPTFTDKTVGSQAGKVFVFTGSNTGIGYLVASILYGANATVYVAARTESKATSAIDSIPRHGLNFFGLDKADRVHL